jgi:hypothetical protein
MGGIIPEAGGSPFFPSKGLVNHHVLIHPRLVRANIRAVDNLMVIVGGLDLISILHPGQFGRRVN